MPTEIREITVRSTVPVALALGAVGGVIGAVPLLLEFAAQTTPGRFLLELVLVTAVGAISTVVVTVVVAVVYNRVADRFGGVQLRLAD